MHNTTISLMERIGLGNPNKIYMHTSQALHDFTLRSYIKNSTHVNSDQKKTHAKNYITMSNGFFYEIHDNGKAPSLALHCHGLKKIGVIEHLLN